MGLQNETRLASMTGDIVAAYLRSNPVAADTLPSLIETVFATLRGLVDGVAAPVSEDRAPAVPVKRSVTADFIVCLEDGKKFKSLKRHLRTRYHMTPEEYRQRWSLPHDYPMVAPSYAKARSELAKRMGLGQARRV